MCQRFLLVLVSCFFLFTLAPVFAADQQPTQGSNQGVSQEDARKLKEAAGVLGNAFGVKPKEDPPKQEQKQPEPPTQKTLADVADKGLEMVKSFVATLSETLKNIAPQVWRVMVRQQYAKAFGELITPWGLFLVVLIFHFIVRRSWTPIVAPDTTGKSDEQKRNIQGEYEFMVGFRRVIIIIGPIIAGSATAVWGVLRIRDAALLLINPEYYAIQDLLKMILR